MVSAGNLGKTYGRRNALTGVTFQIKEGEKVKVFGPNGAGKSTLLRLLAGLESPSQGTLIVGEGEAQGRRETARLVGFAGHEPLLYPVLTVRENLKFYGRMYGLSRLEIRTRMEKILPALGLLDRVDDPVRKLSHGMLRRVGVARALLHHPRVILLDEPFGGLDIISRDFLRRTLDLFRGCTVILTTHDFSDASGGDRVFFLDRGRLVWDGVAKGDAPDLAEQYQRRMEKDA